MCWGVIIYSIVNGKISINKKCLQYNKLKPCFKKLKDFKAQEHEIM